MRISELARAIRDCCILQELVATAQGESYACHPA